MQSVTGFAHALVCQRVALPSSAVIAERRLEEHTMNELVLPVPKTVSATYIVPVPTPMSTVEARQQASRAVGARLTGPLRTLTAEWLAKGVVKVAVEAASPPPPGLLDKELFGTPEQRVLLARARAFVRFSATLGFPGWSNQVTVAQPGRGPRRPHRAQAAPLGHRGGDRPARRLDRGDGDRTRRLLVLTETCCRPPETCCRIPAGGPRRPLHRTVPPQTAAH